MHPASHQEETANLVEKAQVQKKTNKQKNTNNTETQRVSFMAQQSLNWPPKKQHFGYGSQEEGNICC